MINDQNNTGRENSQHERAKAMVAIAPDVIALVEAYEERFVEAGRNVTLRAQSNGIYTFGSNLARNLNSGLHVGELTKKIGYDKPSEVLMAQMMASGLKPSSRSEFADFVIVDGLRFAVCMIAGCGQAVQEALKERHGLYVNGGDVLRNDSFRVTMNRMSLTGFNFYTNDPFAAEGVSGLLCKFPVTFEDFSDIFETTIESGGFGIKLHRDARMCLAWFMKEQNEGRRDTITYTMRSRDGVLSTSGCPAARGEGGLVSDPNSGIGRLCMILASAYDEALDRM